jgi:hypothetical protein
MGEIINSDDFKGRFAIASNTLTQSYNNDYIVYYEKEYLSILLGAELSQIFIDDLISGVPQDQRFKDIFDPFKIDEDCHQLLSSDGIKDMLLGFIYFEICRNIDIKRNVAGNVRNVSDNSSNVGQGTLVNAYNLAQDTFVAIQQYICDNESVYPEFNGQKLEKTSWL